MNEHCIHCHSTVEKLYHPDKYKTMACDHVRRQKPCIRGEYCAFYHSLADKINPKFEITRNNDLSFDFLKNLKPLSECSSMQSTNSEGRSLDLEEHSVSCTKSFQLNTRDEKMSYLIHSLGLDN